jgi:hypothetical protein
MGSIVDLLAMVGAAKRKSGSESRPLESNQSPLDMGSIARFHAGSA